MKRLVDDDLVCIFGMPMPHPKPVLPCWYCEGKDGDGEAYDPLVHHGWHCEACDERRGLQFLLWAVDETIKAAAQKGTELGVLRTARERIGWKAADVMYQDAQSAHSQPTTNRAGEYIAKTADAIKSGGSDDAR